MVVHLWPYTMLSPPMNDDRFFFHRWSFLFFHKICIILPITISKMYPSAPASVSSNSAYTKWTGYGSISISGKGSDIYIRKRIRHPFPGKDKEPDPDPIVLFGSLGFRSGSGSRSYVWFLFIVWFFWIQIRIYKEQDSDQGLDQSILAGLILSGSGFMDCICFVLLSWIWSKIWKHTHMDSNPYVLSLKYSWIIFVYL